MEKVIEEKPTKPPAVPAGAGTDAAGGALVGQSHAFRRLLAEARQVAPLSVGVLLLGETGTGKSTLAKFIHESSPRAAAPFIEVNCAAVPEELIEAELFGYERGAFTGATAAKAGKIEAADGGTLFLDEVGEMSVPMQAKLLKAIESKSVVRLGARLPVQCDVRFIYATNRDTDELREDLVYRIDEARITVAPLRERREDIPALLEHYFRLAQQRMGRAEKLTLAPAAVSVLRDYEWPGNIRQLGNVVLKIALLCAHAQVVDAAAVGSVLRRRASDNPPPREVIEAEDALVTNDEVLLRAPAYERGESLDAYLARVLVALYGELKRDNNHSEVARLFGIDRGTLYSRLRSAAGLLNPAP